MLDRARWLRLCGSIGAEPADADHAFDLLETRYTEDGRSYHTDAHIAECLAHFDTARELAVDPIAVEFATWLHDVIYDPRGSDNEARSARFASKLLLSWGVTGEFAQYVDDLIMITCHTDEPRNEDEQLVVDIDLAILGADVERFDEYDQQIRAEYAWVPEADYNAGRVRILRQFRERPRIYRTAFFHDRFDRPARANLDRAIARLSA